MNLSARPLTHAAVTALTKVAVYRVLQVLSLSSVIGLAGRAQTGPTVLERFQLDSGCQPVAVEITLGGEASELGLTEALVGKTAERHLRESGLLGRFDLEADVPFLSISITVLGDKFHMELLFNKAVIDVSTRLRGHSPMWGRGVTSTHNRTPESVVTAVEPQILNFLADYRRVNRQACDGSKPAQKERRSSSAR